MKKIVVLAIIMVMALGIGTLLRAEEASLYTEEKPEAQTNTTTPKKGKALLTGEQSEVEIAEPAYVIPTNATVTAE